MANEYLAMNQEFTKTADAIRRKSGNSATIEWKAGKGFADAVDGIRNAYEIPFDVPAEYQRVEYLEVDGSAPRVTVSISYTNRARFVFRVQGGADYKGTSIGYRGGSSSSNWNVSMITTTQYFSPYNVFTFGKSYDYIPWTASDPVTYMVSTNSSLSSFDFGTWGNEANFVGKLYYLYILENRPKANDSRNDIILEEYVSLALIPCYRKSDGVNGFYDTVNNVFYTSVSGTFIRGPEVN